MANIGYSTLSVIPSAKGFGAALTKGVAPQMAAAGKTSGAAFSKGLVAGVVAIPALLAVVAIGSLKMGADFQEATTQLVTGAGESEKSIGMIRDGLLAMAPAVGMGPGALAKAMFLVESAGFHGAAGLLVMKAAAEGAKIGGADATVVANGLTTALTDYHLPASMAATVTSQLTATVAAGKTNMQGLAGSMSAVLPAAAAAHIGLSQILGAMATMTGQGISADQASQNLANTIRSLQNPSQVSSKTMAAMGLNSTTVAQNLGKKGLTGTLAELTGAITKHMGPAGLVLQSAFNTSALAAQSANVMLKNLPPSIQGLAKGFLDGSVTSKEWMKATRAMPALQGNLAKQFGTTAKEAHGFNDSLKSGSGPGKTYSAILADMLGGATGLNTGLALTGPNMGTFSKNVTDISKASAEAGGHVKGWAATQADFNVKIDQAKAGISAFAIKIGDKLLPAATKIVSAFTDNVLPALTRLSDWISNTGVPALGKIETWITKTGIPALSKFSGWVSDNKDKLKILAEFIGVVLIPVFADMAVKAVASAVTQAGAWVSTQIAGVTSAASQLASHYVIVGGWVVSTAKAVASAATTAVIWGMYKAEAISGAAVSVASLVAVGAAWVWSGVTAMGAAVVMAAAWVVGLGPVAWVIAAVVAVIAVIVLIATKTTWFQTVWKAMTAGIALGWQWLWNSILAPIIRFILNGFASITDGIANVLRVLSNIPGFGWAKVAADKMGDAATKAHALANGIKDIPPNKKVAVTVTYGATWSAKTASIVSALNTAAKGHIVAGVGMSGGGPVSGVSTSDTEPRMLTPGEFVVRRDGSNIADALKHFGAKAVTPVAGFDYDRMAAAMSRVRLDLDGRNVAASVDQRLAPR